MPHAFDRCRIDLAVAEDGTVFVLHESDAFGAAVSSFSYEAGARRLTARDRDGGALVAAPVAADLAPHVDAAARIVVALVRDGTPRSGSLVPVAAG